MDFIVVMSCLPQVMITVQFISGNSQESSWR